MTYGRIKQTLGQADNMAIDEKKPKRILLRFTEEEYKKLNVFRVQTGDQTWQSIGEKLFIDVWLSEELGLSPGRLDVDVDEIKEKLKKLQAELDEAGKELAQEIRRVHGELSEIERIAKENKPPTEPAGKPALKNR